MIVHVMLFFSACIVTVLFMVTLMFASRAAELKEVLQCSGQNLEAAGNDNNRTWRQSMPFYVKEGLCKSDKLE